MNVRKQIAIGIALWLRVMTCMALGDQGPQLNLTVPKFVPLETSEESLSFSVKDENTTTELVDVSFWGSTAISGVCREDNDSVTSIHLAYTQKIKIVEQEYKSVRYPDKQLCLVEKTNIDGTVTDGLLVPAKLVVCGIERISKDEHAWFFGKIDQLERLDKNHEKHTDENHADVVVAKHIDHLSSQQPMKKTDKHNHKKYNHRPHGPAAVKVLEEQEHFADKKIVVLEKQTGAMEQKTVVQAVTDLLVAIIGVFKAVFETIRGLFM